MRQLIVQVPKGNGGEVLRIAERSQGMNLAVFEGRGPAGPLDIALAHLPNGEIESFLNELQGIEGLQVTLAPRGILAFAPPAASAPERVTDVGARSPIEIFFAGLQSIGSWKGFLGYAAAAGVVVWIGLYTNTVYLLTASMLIAPFAGPAMNAAVATARGDRTLLGRTLLRYFAALAVTILIAGLLSLVMGQEVATPLMLSISELSSVAVLLPLVGGAAGALNLVQSDRSSLVSGAAVGMLVSVSLAPPAGLIGMSLVLGEWRMAGNASFVLLQTLAGLNLSGALVFRLYGLSPRGTRYDRGERWMSRLAFTMATLVLAALAVLQLWDEPEMQRSTRSQRAVAEIQRVVREDERVRLVEASARFTNDSLPNQQTLLVELYVQATGLDDGARQELRSSLTRVVQEHLLREFEVTPLVDVTVLEPPGG